MKKTKFFVTKNGNPLDPTLYIWDERTKTFCSQEDELVLDFTDVDGCTFKTGPYCRFNTGPNCTFKTGDNCVLIRYDVKGVLEIPAGKTIRTNEYGIAGYTVLEPEKTSCDGKVVEIEGVKYKLVEQKVSSVPAKENEECAVSPKEFLRILGLTPEQSELAFWQAHFLYEGGHYFSPHLLNGVPTCSCGETLLHYGQKKRDTPDFLSIPLCRKWRSHLGGNVRELAEFAQRNAR